MKNKIILFTFCLVAIFNSSCEQSNNINYHSRHAEAHEQLLLNLELGDEKLDSMSSLKLIDVDTSIKRHDDFKMLGWHMYNGNKWKNYNFKLLYAISYFNYKIHPETGLPQHPEVIQDWKKTAMIDSAKKHNCKVFLTVASFGTETDIFLKNQSAWDPLYSNILELLELRNADGINIDIEHVGKNKSKDLAQFVEFMSTKLKKANPEYMVSLCLYSVDWNDVFDIKALNPHIDFYTLMSYDYHGIPYGVKESIHRYTGPVGQLYSSPVFGEYSVKWSVDKYIEKGVLPEKLIVGVPYYGACYHVSDDLPYTEVKRTYNEKSKLWIPNISKPTYSGAIAMSNKHNLTHTMESSGGAYFTLVGKDTLQYWFDSKEVIQAKYSYIKNNKLGGAGIFALGYDDGDSNLWQLAIDNFGIKK